MSTIPSLDDPDSALCRLIGEVQPSNELHSGDEWGEILDSGRLSFIARLLKFRVATAADRSIREACTALLDRLPLDAAARLLRSPVLCGALRSGAELKELADLIEGELALDSKSEQHLERWSAFGDVWLGANAPPPDVPTRLVDGRYLSPTVACGIPIDLSLPPGVGRPTAGLRDPRLPDAEETTQAIAIIDQAIKLLGNLSPAGYSIVRALTSTFVLRIDEGRPDEAWGASSGMVIGRTVLVNSAKSRPSLVAEHILHEATHTAIDCAELRAPLLLDSREVADELVLSPWTGNALTIHAFLHACAVWAVLLEYWSAYCVDADDRDAVARCAYVRRGFEQLDDNTLTRFRRILSEGAVRLVTRARSLANDVTIISYV